MKCSIRGNQEAVEVGNMGADFILHPLIHTFPSRNPAQNLVAWSQKVQCGLKYDIRILADIIFLKTSSCCANKRVRLVYPRLCCELVVVMVAKLITI